MRQSAVLALGGVATASDSTPATWAGTTFISTLDASGASPPGTYRPTRETGTVLVSTTAPGATSARTSAGVPSVSATARRRRIDSSNAARTPGSSSSAQRASTSAGTRRCSGSTPSNRSANSRSAASPRSATAAQIGSTTATACSTSKAPRGTTAR